MSTGTFAAFRRVFPRRDLYRGRALLSAAFSVAASLLLCLLLFSGYLIADLLATGGRLVIDAGPDAVARLAALSDHPVARAGAEAKEGLLTEIEIGDGGILPAVWWC